MIKSLLLLLGVTLVVCTSLIKTQCLYICMYSPYLVSNCNDPFDFHVSPLKPAC